MDAITYTAARQNLAKTMDKVCMDRSTVIFRTAADELNVDKKLHTRLFWHTAVPHLNKVTDVEIE